MKKLLLIFKVIAFLLICLPLSAYAGITDYSENFLTFYCCYIVIMLVLSALSLNFAGKFFLVLNFIILFTTMILFPIPSLWLFILPFPFINIFLVLRKINSVKYKITQGKAEEIQETEENLNAEIKDNILIRILRYMFSISYSDHSNFETTGWTILHYAIEKDQFDTAMMLIAKGANVNAASNLNVTPLLLAVSKGHKELVDLLIRKGADVKVVTSDKIYDEYSWTPLHYAAKKGFKDIAKLLIAAGADVNAKSDDGKTPLDLALAEDIKQTLIDLGAKSGKDL